MESFFMGKAQKKDCTFMQSYKRYNYLTSMIFIMLAEPSPVG